MLTSLDPGALEIYSRDDIIGILLEHGTPQVAVWIGREAEFGDYGQDIMTIRLQHISARGLQFCGHRDTWYDTFRVIRCRIWCSSRAHEDLRDLHD
jgi:hypothetical protein